MFVNAIRAKVRESGAEFHVVKNTLARRVFAEQGIRYAAPFVSLDEPRLVPKQLWEGLRDVIPGLTAEETGRAIEIPVDKQGADILYVALAGAHSIRPAAVIFHEAKESWTLSYFEAANYGFFFGDAAKARQIADRFMDEALRLGVKEVCITECGHAYRVADIFHEA